MNSRKIYISVVLFFFCLIQGSAQQVLTLENAVKLALENNFEIKIATNDLQIEKTNVTSGNAGMLPKATATIVDNNGVQNLSQTRSDGTVTKLDNAKSSNITYGVGLDWTIFDGFKMFAKMDQLKELQKLGEAQLKMAILTKISDVNSTYFDLVQQQQEMTALDSTLVLSKQRLTLAQNRFSIGKASKLEVLNAQVDLNTDTALLLKQKELYANTKISMNQILARSISEDFKVRNEIEVDNKLDLKELYDLSKKQNPSLEVQVINKRVAELQLKQVKANRYPNVKLNTGYNFNETQSGLGFTTQSSARGLNYGFSASLNIFDGFAQKRNEKIAQLQLNNASIAIEQQNAVLESQVATAFQSYQTNLQLIDLEIKNEAIAKQNLDITVEKFRIGTITTIEFRTAQLNYLTAKVRNSNAHLQAKLSEIALKELAGNLSL
jgi:outer membrane protein TolC